MTLYQFSHLDKIEQEESISDEGVFLASRDKGDLMFDLYQIGSFYIEFYYKINASHHGIKMRCFTDTDELMPYLEKIDLAKFF